ncbi:MAG: hypothetical protein ACRDIA_04000, partial [Actinomycetota bacterium]
DGPFPGARFRQIMSLTSDALGNIYVADRAAGKSDLVRIRVLNRGSGPVELFAPGARRVEVAPGHIATIMGTPVGSRSPALAVGGPFLYIAKSLGGRSSVVALNLGSAPATANGVDLAAGVMGAVAGGGPMGFSGDGGPALSARFSQITGMSADAQGNLFVADRLNNRIRRIDPFGTVTTFAGTGPAGSGRGGYNGNTTAAGRARLNAPFDVKSGPAGRVWISDTLNGQVRVVDPSGVIRAAPGNGIGMLGECAAGPPGVPSPGSRPRGAGPHDVAVTADGRTFAAVPAVGQVKEIGSPGVVTTAAGRGLLSPLTDSSGASTPEKGARAAPLKGPDRVAAAKNGLYILDAPSFRVRFVNFYQRSVVVHGRTVPASGIVTVAGNGVFGSTGDGGRAVDATIDPQFADIAADSAGNLFLSDPEHNRLRLIDPRGIIKTVAPDPAPHPPSCCMHPQGLVVDTRDNLYISESVEPRVWFWNRGGGDLVVHGLLIKAGTSGPVAGTGLRGFEGDGGPGPQAQFMEPLGLFADRAGNLYIADRAANNIRRLDAGGRVSTIAGTGQAGFNGDGLSAALTWLAGPQAVSLDGCGNLVIADTGNDRVRRLHLKQNCEPSTQPEPILKGTGARLIRIAMGIAAVAALVTTRAIVRLRERSRPA